MESDVKDYPNADNVRSLSMSGRLAYPQNYAGRSFNSHSRLNSTDWSVLVEGPDETTSWSFRLGVWTRGGDRSEAWDRETMFSQLAKRSSQNVDSGVRNNKCF